MGGTRARDDAPSLELIVSCLIFVPLGHDDEPEILRYEITLVCPISANVRQYEVFRSVQLRAVRKPSSGLIPTFGTLCFVRR